VKKKWGGSSPWYLLINDRVFFDANFLKLPANAAIYLIRLRGQFNPKTSKHNLRWGEITVKMPYSEIEKIKGYSRATVIKIIRRLEKYEIIKRTFQGGLFGLANEFSISGIYTDFPRGKRLRNVNQEISRDRYYLRIEGEMLRDPEIKKLHPGAFLLWCYCRVEWIQNYQMPGLELEENQFTMPNFQTKREGSFSRWSLMRYTEELIETGHINRDIQGGRYRVRSVYSFTGKYGSLKQQKRRSEKKGMVWY